MLNLNSFFEYSTNFVGDTFGFNSKISQLKSALVKLQAELDGSNSALNQLSKDMQEIVSADATLKIKVSEMQKLIDYHDLAHAEENMITSKRPFVNVSYSRVEVGGSVSTDVRNFFQPNDYNLPLVTGVSNDDKALECLKWVRKNVTYVSDKTNYGFDEYWAFAYQTLKRKKGDCEDGAILLANVMLKAGIPYYRVHLNAGSVNGGGHAYVSYCREFDNEFVVLDWCYWPNNLPVKDRLTHKEERNYMDKDRNFYVWFSWDLLHAYGDMTLLGGMPDYFVK